MTKRIVLNGDPRTKKNSQRIVVQGKRRFIMPSAQYQKYETACLWQLKGKRWQLEGPLNLRCVYYMATRRKVDLVNLHESILDILVKAGVLADDNRDVVATMDGSHVEHDKNHPRVEITITQIGGEYEVWGKRSK